MAFVGRHKVYALFWTWSHGPFVCMSDIQTAQGSKSCGALQRCRLNIYPRSVPLSTTPGARATRSDQGYMDVLRPNDWVFVFVDPFDGDAPEPLFMGFIDDIRFRYELPITGAFGATISVSCSGWEKALQNTMVLSNQWLSTEINFANLIDIATRITDGGSNQIPQIGNAIASVVQTFLEAESSEAFLQRRATSFRPRNAMAEIEYEELTGVAIDPAATQLNAAGLTPINAIMGQFELPQTRTPLWRFIKMKFEDLPDRTFTVPRAMVSMLGMPLSRFIDEWSNPTMNALLYDVRRLSNDGLSHLEIGRHRLNRSVEGGYLASAISEVVGAASSVSSAVGQLFEDIAPHIILMRRPLFQEELLDLEGPTFSSKDLTSLALGISDADHYNLSWLENTSLDPAQHKAASGLTGFDFDRPRALDMIRRHGLRIYQDQTNAWPDRASESEPPTIPVPSPHLFREWNSRLQISGLDQVELLTGDCSIPKYVRGLFLGGKFQLDIALHPGVFAEGTSRVFYVDGMDWNYTAATGQFTTGIALSRGYEVGANDVTRVVRPEAAGG